MTHILQTSYLLIWRASVAEWVFICSLETEKWRQSALKFYMPPKFICLFFLCLLVLLLNFGHYKWDHIVHSTAADTYLSTCLTVFSIVRLCCSVKIVKQTRVWYSYSTDPACDRFTDMLFCSFLRCQTVVWPLQLSLCAVWECGVWAFSICLS